MTVREEVEILFKEMQEDNNEYLCYSELYKDEEFRAANGKIIELKFKEGANG